MKEIVIELIKKVFDFKTLIVLLVVVGALKYEWAVVFLGLATDSVLDFVRTLGG